MFLFLLEIIFFLELSGVNTELYIKQTNLVAKLRFPWVLDFIVHILT